jgi:pimeloyl-ACP methyl ester carboxylesterase
MQTEAYYVHCLEQFRRQLGIEKMILLGHSMGGFVVSRYACTHPSRVAHLILVDPWGLVDHPAGVNWSNPMPVWIRSTYLTRINPLRIVRAMGPVGPFVSKVASYYVWNRYTWFLKVST